MSSPEHPTDPTAPGASTSPDLFLARRAAKGDADAWTAIVDRFGGAIYNLAYRFTRQSQEAEDLTQEIFLKLYRQLGRYRGDVPLMAWTLRLSRNLCIDHYRQQKSRRRDQQVSLDGLEHLASEDDSEGRRQRREERRLVLEALDELTVLQATVLTLRDFQGLSYEEIATFLEVPVGTIKSRLNRARRELVEVLGRRLGLTPGSAAKGRTPSDDSNRSKASSC